MKFSRASPSLPVQIVVVCQANVQKRALSPDQFVTHGERRWTAERRGSWRRRWATSEQNVWRNARVTPRAESLRDGLGRGCDREGTTPFCVRSCIATERDNDHAPRQGSPPVLRHRWGRRRRSFGSARYWRHRSEGKRPEDIRDALWGSGIPLSYPLLVLPPLFPTRNCTAARSDRSSPPRVRARRRANVGLTHFRRSFSHHRQWSAKLAMPPTASRSTTESARLNQRPRGPQLSCARVQTTCSVLSQS